jgi:hypothetical protein
MVKTSLLIALVLTIVQGSFTGKKTTIIPQKIEDYRSEGKRDPFAGIYGIWYGSNEAVLASQIPKRGPGGCSMEGL